MTYFFLCSTLSIVKHTPINDRCDDAKTSRMSHMSPEVIIVAASIGGCTWYLLEHEDGVIQIHVEVVENSRLDEECPRISLRGQ